MAGESPEPLSQHQAEGPTPAGAPASDGTSSEGGQMSHYDKARARMGT